MKVGEKAATDLLIVTQKRRIAALEKENSDIKTACAEIIAEAVLIMARHSKNGMRDLERWIAEMGGQ